MVVHPNSKPASEYIYCLGSGVEKMARGGNKEQSKGTCVRRGIFILDRDVARGDSTAMLTLARKPVVIFSEVVSGIFSSDYSRC